MRSLVVMLFALALPAAGLAFANRGVIMVDPPLAWIAAAALAAATWLTLAWRGARHGLRVVAAFGVLALASDGLIQQAVVYANQRFDRTAPATLTAVVEGIEPHGAWFGVFDHGACDVLLPWRSARAPLRLALAGSTMLRDPTGGNADICRTAEASPVRRGERVALRVHAGALGFEYLAAAGGQSVLTPPCSTCGKGH
ncbi:MAG: hypothetical protein ABI629_04390 [bacterium]